ncbi:flagellin [Brevibacillus sp. VP]|nr:flagellin [Brevibacillus sp. VP]
MICYLHVFYFLNHPFVQDDFVLFILNKVALFKMTTDTVTSIRK